MKKCGKARKTFYYDHKTGNWSVGPTLIQSRFSHAAGIVIDEYTQEEIVIVTGGFHVSQTEMLLDNTWSKGEKI